MGLQAHSSNKQLSSQSSYSQQVNEINTLRLQKMSKDILIEACVKLVTVNGRPFSNMDDSGFNKKI